MKSYTLEYKWTVSRDRDTYGYNICTLYVNNCKAAQCTGGGYDMQGTCLGHWIALAFADRLRMLKLKDMPEHTHWQYSHTRICAGKCHEEWCNAERIQDLPEYPQDCLICPVCGCDTKSSNNGQTINDVRYFYGLSYHDPNFDPGKAVIGQDCDDRTFSGKSAGKTVEQAEKDGDTVGLERYQAFYSASSKVPTKWHTVPLIDGACGMSSVEIIGQAIGLQFQYIPTRSNSQTIYNVTDTSGD